MRLLRPYLKVMRRYESIPDELVREFEVLDPDERMPVNTGVELLAAAVELTGDPDLGLKAAREIEPGMFGAIEYTLGTAATLRDAIGMMGRYTRLVNDALSLSLAVEGNRAILRFESALAVPRAGADFQSAVFYVWCMQRFPAHLAAHHEVSFTHGRPEDTSEYEATFVSCRILFDQPFNGVSFPVEDLDRELPDRDPNLHEVMRKHSDQLLAELPKADSLTERVRAFVVSQLRGGNPTATHTAEALHLSPRTLARRLADENTSFKQLLDDLRRGLALRYASKTDIPLHEIAFLLGLSNAAAFTRAFKRWTGMTPLEYRRAHRGR